MVGVGLPLDLGSAYWRGLEQLADYRYLVVPYTIASREMLNEHGLVLEFEN